MPYTSSLYHHRLHILPPHLSPRVRLPQGIVSNRGKIPFHLYFSIKDILVFILVFLLLPILPAYWGTEETSHQQSHLSQPIVLNPDDASCSLSCAQSLANLEESVLLPLLPQVRSPLSLVCWLPQHFYSFSRHGFQVMLEDFRDFITWWCCDEWARQHRQELVASPLSAVDVSTANGQSPTAEALGWCGKSLLLSQRNSLIAILTVQLGMWSQGSTVASRVSV